MTDVALRNALPESHVIRKLSCVVRRGGIGKASRECMPQLSMHKRDGSLVPYPTACPVQWRLVGVIPSSPAPLVWEQVRLDSIPAFYPMALLAADAAAGAA